MASTYSTFASFRSSSAYFMGPKVSIKEPSSMPTAVQFRPLRISAACTSTAERVVSHIASPSSLYEVLGFRWAPRVRKSRLLTGDWREFYTRTSRLTVKIMPPHTSSSKYMKLTLRCLILRNAPIMIERFSSGQGGPLPFQHPPHRCPVQLLLDFLDIRGEHGKLINVGETADKL